MRSRGFVLLAAAACLIGLPDDVLAQRDCQSLGSGEVSGVYNTLIIRAANLQCGDLRVRADSAYSYQQSSQYNLFGRVRIENPEIRLQARNAQYDPDEGRISAQGAIDLLRKQDSTTIRNGENLTMFRAGFGGRTEDALTVEGGRPRAILRPKRAEGAPADSVPDPPYEIDANRIEVIGDDQFRATGNVQIHRGELDATADEVRYFGESGQLSLTGNARLNTEKYDLSGGVVVVTMNGDEISDVIARQNAQLSGDIEITAGVIQLALVGGALDRLVAGPDTGPSGAAPQGTLGAPTPARPPGAPAPVQAGILPGAAAPAAADAARAVATAEEFTMTGDRLVIDVNGDLVESVQATGAARMLSFAGDSLNAPDTPEIVRRDWMEGDTILATFSAADSTGLTGDTVAGPPDSVSVADTVARAVPDSASVADSTAAAKPTLVRLEAIGNARALYRLPAADTTASADSTCAKPGRFAVHYVIGNTIVIAMKDGVADAMEVTGQVAGEHLEPPPCRASPAPVPAAPPPGGTPPPPGPADRAPRDGESVLPPRRQPEPTPASR
jgi:lipopolysaccharide export system protein LptA